MTRETLGGPIEVGHTFNNETHAGSQASLAEGLSEPHQTSTLGKHGVSSKTAEKMAKLLKGKEKEWAAAVEKKGPLQLLDLPVDVLREIIKEVTHTNDLATLALTHSSLNSLAIPLIYSRFDIVWPETQVTTDPRTGVDALTYGLSTLVLSSIVNHEGPYCADCGKLNQRTFKTAISNRKRHYNFAGYTRKFSLGNGPSEWVQEYLISKESGKMLGTLVALAVRQMWSLETFVWDMPTGILQDVWSALSSFRRKCDCEEPRLQRIHIRCHDNKSSVSPQIAGPLAHSNSTIHGAGGANQQSISVAADTTGNADLLRDLTRETLLAKSYRNVEHPNFSILPALKSITVLDIDELAYLDELSVLIERSIERLRELRLGTASLWHAKNWTISDVASLPDATTNSVPGGMLGMVMCKIYDCEPPVSVLKRNSHNSDEGMRQADAELVADVPLGSSLSPILPIAVDNLANCPIENDSQSHDDSATHFLPRNFVPISAKETTTDDANLLVSDSLGSISTLPRSHSEYVTTPEILGETLPVRPASLTDPAISQNVLPLRFMTSSDQPCSIVANVNGRSSSKQRKLKLEILELEKTPLCVPVLQKTIDWTVLTTLTLLNCESDEEFWKALRRTYSPRTTSSSTLFSPTSNSVHSPRHHLKKTPSIPLSDYALRLRKIHTNNVSPSLIAFLKDTLAPNTLEWMFLQDGWGPLSKVTVDAIYKGPLRRHRESLKKVMIDSGGRRSTGSSRNTKWKKWMLNEEVLSFVTSGKMSALRELAMAVEYKHWHFFLQRLPQIPHLRSLYIPFIADHVHGHELESKELGLQVLDIVHLRPEIELCYMGIATKCFEILETKHSNDLSFSHSDPSVTPANIGSGNAVTEEAAEDSDSNEDNEDDEDDDEDSAQDGTAPVEQEANDSDSPDDSETNSDDEDAKSDGVRKRPRLKLREILFYDDKVSIFKARHGQL